MKHPLPDPADSRRIGDIEVLRAFAIGLVLVEHVRLNLLPWVSGHDDPVYTHFGFWSGVDLFLAISGFVIARSLLPLLAATTGAAEFFNTALSFWVRRAWRLLPSAWAWLAVILVAAAAFNRSHAFQPFGANLDGVIAAALNIANLHTAYLFGHRPIGAAFPYWSLSLEEQFYVALPLLTYALRRRLPLALALAVAAQFWIRRVGPDGHILLNELRNDALSLGVLLAIWSGRPGHAAAEPRILRRRALQFATPIAGLFAFSILTGPALIPDTFLVGVTAFLAAGLVWLASYDSDYLFPPGRIKRALCWLGARSYALYLIHIPAFFAAQEIWFRLDPQNLAASPRHMAELLITGFGLLFPLAELNYRFLETPLRRRGAVVAERIRRRDLAALAGAPSPSYA